MTDRTKHWLGISAVVVPLAIAVISAVMAWGALRQEVTDNHERISELEQRAKHVEDNLFESLSWRRNDEPIEIDKETGGRVNRLREKPSETSRSQHATIGVQPHRFLSASSRRRSPSRFLFLGHLSLRGCPSGTGDTAGTNGIDAKGHRNRAETPSGSLCRSCSAGKAVKTKIPDHHEWPFPYLGPGIFAIALPLPFCKTGPF